MATILATIFTVVLVSSYMPASWAQRVNSGKPGYDDDFSVTIRMPNAVSERPDSLMCTSQKLGPEETYIVKFTPHASKATAHHLMVYGCEVPASRNDSWTCDEYESPEANSEHAVCGYGRRQIMFAWALDAPEKSLPEGVGLRVSGDTNINYLVVQLHYSKVFEPGVTDNSGVTLDMTHHRPPQQAGYLVLGNWGSIPPHMPAAKLEASCTFELDYTIYPIGYRTHSHNLGVVTSGYRIRDGEWMEIGRMSPQLPQTFYEPTHPGMDIRQGDVLASRCTMNSMNRDTDTIMGPTNHDEMCNFYIMYSTYNQDNLKTTFCFDDSNTYSWLDDFSPKEIPETASSLEGIDGAEEVLKKFKWE